MSKRPPPPPLEFEPPWCCMCNNQTEVVDNELVCKPCGASWDPNLYWQHGAWDDTEAVRCDQVWTPNEREHRCVRTAGHGGEHHAGEFWQRWETEDSAPRIVTVELPDGGQHG